MENNILALALFFSVLIGLLYVIVYLFRNYFIAYSNLYSHPNEKLIELQNQFDLHKRNLEVVVFEDEINCIINNRIKELDLLFPNEASEKTKEIEATLFLQNTKKAIYTSLYLLKRKQ